MRTVPRGLVLACVLAPAALLWRLSAGGEATSLLRQTSKVQQSLNLKVLPREMSSEDLRDLMSHYNEELGVGCSYCHVRDSRTHQLEYASDENPRKQVARLMIGMVRDINEKYLARVGDRRYALAINCGNCHQGQTSPPEFNPERLP